MGEGEGKSSAILHLGPHTGYPQQVSRRQKEPTPHSLELRHRWLRSQEPPAAQMASPSVEFPQKQSGSEPHAVNAPQCPPTVHVAAGVFWGGCPPKKDKEALATDTATRTHNNWRSCILIFGEEFKKKEKNVFWNWARQILPKIAQTLLGGRSAPFFWEKDLLFSQKVGNFSFFFKKKKKKKKEPFFFSCWCSHSFFASLSCGFFTS